MGASTYNIGGGCVLCMTCLSVCPAGAIAFPPGGDRPRIDADACTGCGACIENCPAEAIEAVATNHGPTGDDQ